MVRFSSALCNFEKHGFVQMLPKTMVQLKLCSGLNTILYVSLQRFGQQMSWSTWLHISTIMQRGLHGLMLQLCLDPTHIIIGTYSNLVQIYFSLAFSSLFLTSAFTTFWFLIILHFIYWSVINAGINPWNAGDMEHNREQV